MVCSSILFLTSRPRCGDSKKKTQNIFERAKNEACSNNPNYAGFVYSNDVRTGASGVRLYESIRDSNAAKSRHGSIPPKNVPRHLGG